MGSELTISTLSLVLFSLILENIFISKQFPILSGDSQYLDYKDKVGNFLLKI